MTQPVQSVEKSQDLASPVRAAHKIFAVEVEPYRPELHRFCRSLAANVWDAEDLVQETLTRAFADLGGFQGKIDNMRPWLFRVATNLWIDRQRRAGRVTAVADTSQTAGEDEPPELTQQVREALTAMARELPPRQCAAVLLKDVFGFSLHDIGAFLGMHEAGVKSLLFRARERLADLRARPAPSRSTAPRAAVDAADRALIDSFVEAFNARDVARLMSLMLPGVRAEVYGLVHGVDDGFARGTIQHTFGEEGLLRAERREYDGIPIILLWYRVEQHGKSIEAVRDVIRLEDDGGGRCTRLRYFYFCPDVLREVTATLGAPVFTQGYRY